jgi:hypothetical protein
MHEGRVVAVGEKEPILDGDQARSRPLEQCRTDPPSVPDPASPPLPARAADLCGEIAGAVPEALLGWRDYKSEYRMRRSRLLCPFPRAEEVFHPWQPEP